MTPILQTERLVLRAITLDDAPAIQKYFNNWNIVQHLSMRVPWPYPDDGAETFIREQCLPKMEEGSSLVWGITLKEAENDEAVGVVDYRFDDDDYGNRGFWIAEHLWRQGLMTEAVTAMQDYVFFELGVADIVVCNSIVNDGSRRVKEKTNAEYLGDVTLPHHSGQDQAQKWRIIREGWAEFRGRSLQDLPQTPDTPPANHRPRQKKTSTP